MAHNLNYNEDTQKHSFMSVKEKAWHGLGTIINDYPTSAEAIKYAQLDYTVEKRPLFTYDTENNTGDPDTDIICLLYTSDAADDLLCVDLGGRRIIKKKK